MAGFESVQRAEQDGYWDIEPSMGGTLLQQLRKVHAGTLATSLGLSTTGMGQRGGQGQPVMVGIFRDWPPFSADWWAIMPGTV